ncbi:AAA domain-containing protein [Leptospira interrogans]|uniref:UvrD/REP helicase N-terminal domain protein n=2 Tax=Leptospira interrogans TaxID=173 RepID=A0A0F6I8C0_LEPIR|nr:MULTISPECIES: AAA domain-containing protein [Leptospira]EJO76657.1 UvrD/REP helicase N-terminal domain protein [Leptospira interrogans serovar Pomona str. Kennewicki LC82-25]EJP06034.1 UvrD/REP helicase N-terminal domain protein [Leptospira interrogans serovar Bulgarica str. Mallika]EKN99444.1 UvrD/REP helicase N-terminal domain protein [Leptospira interrogans serovar Pomona str. Pomona]EKR34926.1 UvrD/REP helicase N-terminal domain protein [Leptospira interrogans serovar Hebdomadis str. R49
MKDRNFSDSISELEFVKTELEREKEEEDSIFSKDWLSRPIPDRVRQGITLYPIVYEEQTLGREGNWILTFRFSNQEEYPIKFQTGAPVQLGKNEDRAKAILVSLHKEKIKISIEEVPEWAEEGKCFLDLLPDETSYKEMFNALDAVRLATKGTRLYVNRELLLGYGKPDLISTRDSDRSRILGRISTSLNESQKNAVIHSVLSEDVMIIHGPPGTGKTTTLTEIVSQLVAEEKKILVSAPTNSACDLLVESISTRGILVLRLGHPARVNEIAIHSTLDYKLFHHPDGKLLNEYRKDVIEISKQAKKFKRNFGEKEREERKKLFTEVKELKKTIRSMEIGLIDSLVSSHPVIVSTPVASARGILENRTFDFCVLDESSQALEPAFWISILKSDRVILAGDHKQLPPTLFSEKNYLETTLFEKAAENLESYGRVFLLDTQYRMKDEISAFPSKEFYSGLLKSGRSEKERKSNFPKTFPFSNAFQWIDTSGTDSEEVILDDSISNPFEADLQVRLCFLLKENDWPEDEITILSPYRAQVRLISEKLRDVGLTKINVSTIDSFQGRENRCILLGFVRSNLEGRSGFLKESRRINVGMTRARDLLLCIGDSSTLSQDPFLSKLIRFAEEKEVFRTAWEF